MNLSVEPSRPHQSLVQDVGAVSGGEHNHTAVGPESVHLGKKLVQSVFPLIVGRESDILATGPAHCVNLVDEHYAGSLLLSLGKQVTHTAGTHAHEHLHEIRTADAEERHIGFSGYSFGQQGLTRARRADEQRTLGYLAAERGIFAGILEEIHDFHHLFLRAVQTGHILEGDIHLILVCELALGLAHIERVHSATLTLAAAHLTGH